MPKKYLDRNVNQVITWSRNQVKDPTQDWTALVSKSHCRQAYGVAGLGRVRDHCMACYPSGAEADRDQTVIGSTR
jgi:hypothetical protein